MWLRVLLTVCLCVCIKTSVGLADELRNVKAGEPIPAFAVEGLDGKAIAARDFHGKVLAILYVSAQQRQSEAAIKTAHEVTSKIGSKDLALVYMSPNTDKEDYFRKLRDRLLAHEPFGLDKDRKIYGQFGLIVFPTTVIVDKEGKLLHVVAGWTRDYGFELDLYCRHALGEISDARLAERMSQGPVKKDQARDKANRHRAAAAILRKKGMLDSAVTELKRAMKIDPESVDAVLELADIYIQRDDLDQAQSTVDALVSQKPNARGLELVYGHIALKRGNLEGAQRFLEQALVLNPDPVRTHYYLAQVFEKKGEVAKAMEHYKKALKRVLNEN